MLLILRGKEALSIHSKIGLTIRTITGLGSFGCLFTALQFIDLIQITLLLQTMPLFITFLAPFLIREEVGIVKYAMVFTGFIGVILILNPQKEGWINIGTIFGLLSPFFGALMVISLRKLGKTDHPASTALW